ncbi:hydrolase [Carbonactinospora thermoautotrophica]|uniref:Hydrolase n=2 Tax=Carbonactinospora thermoautotrophica TaxID=1469144 RepID=A0A132N6J5_9ACTN|nr:amidohydrolase family protein [Carbonactinospora thermoautotrophica]KWX00477.1 hydrolase [Carbonactinospora thermoautotrophica]KWX05636.1 hydrolase [Carbonactinospora thermoautotrophica]
MSEQRLVFDFHVRLAPRPGAVDWLLAVMDECQIDRAVVCAGGVIDIDRLSRQLIEGGHIEADADNDAVLTGCARSGGRLVPFFFANPHRSPDRYQKRAEEFRGLEISPAVHGVPLTDERTAALVEVAAEVGHPVYLVCIDRPGCRVADLVRLAEAFPDVTFVLGHAGIGNIDFYAIDLITPWRNVLLETSGGYTSVAKAAIERLGADRVLFGSEHPLQHPSVELAKFRALDLSPEIWRQIAWRNACRVLGEDLEEEQP